MIPVDRTVSYFSVIPMDGSDLQRLIHDPAAAAPPKLLEICATSIVLVACSRPEG